MFGVICFWCVCDVKYISYGKSSQKSLRATGLCSLIYFHDSQTSVSTFIPTCISVSVPDLYLQLPAQHVHSESSEKFASTAPLVILPFRPDPTAPTHPHPTVYSRLAFPPVFCIRKDTTMSPSRQTRTIGVSLGPSHPTFSPNFISPLYVFQKGIFEISFTPVH